MERQTTEEEVNTLSNSEVSVTQGDTMERWNLCFIHVCVCFIYSLKRIFCAINASSAPVF
jgi:hypothetical protein